jgi:hypothetical protein
LALSLGLGTIHDPFFAIIVVVAVIINVELHLSDHPQSTSSILQAEASYSNTNLAAAKASSGRS